MKKAFVILGSGLGLIATIVGILTQGFTVWDRFSSSEHDDFILWESYSGASFMYPKNWQVGREPDFAAMGRGFYHPTQPNIHIAHYASPAMLDLLEGDSPDREMLDYMEDEVTQKKKYDKEDNEYDVKILGNSVFVRQLKNYSEPWEFCRIIYQQRERDKGNELEIVIHLFTVINGVQYNLELYCPKAKFKDEEKEFTLISNSFTVDYNNLWNGD